MIYPYPKPLDLLIDRANFHKEAAARFDEIIKRNLVYKYPDAPQKLAFHEAMLKLYLDAVTDLKKLGKYDT